MRHIPAHVVGKTIQGAVRAAEGPAFYGKVHETGGARAYEIMAVKGRALKFIAGDREVFVRKTFHPAALTRSFMRSSLAENEGSIREQLQDAIDEQLRD